MSFAQSTLGYLLSALQKRLQAYWNSLPDNFLVYLLAPIYSMFSLNLVLAIMAWWTLSVLCLCWIQGHASDDTCICNNLGLRKRKRLNFKKIVKKGPLFANPPRRLATPPKDTMDTPSNDVSDNTSAPVQFGLQTPSWNTYSSGINGSFTHRFASDSSTTRLDSSFVANASLGLSDIQSYFVSPSSGLGLDSASCVIPSATSPWTLRQSSTAKSFQACYSSIATPSKQSDLGHQVEVSLQLTPRIPDGTLEAPGANRLETKLDIPERISSRENHAEMFIQADDDLTEDPLIQEPSPIIAVQTTISASPQTVSVSRLMAQEGDCSQIMDESLGSFMVPPTPTPCSTSSRQSNSCLDSDPIKLVQASRATTPVPEDIRITITSPRQDERQSETNSEPMGPAMDHLPEEHLLSANAAAMPNPMLTPGRGRGPSFIPLPPTPIDNVLRPVTFRQALTECTNILPQKPKEKHWRKKKSKGQAQAQLQAQPMAKPLPHVQLPVKRERTHTAEKPNWAVASAPATGASDVSLFKRLKIEPPAIAEPSVKRVRIGLYAGEPLINRIHGEPSSVRLPPQPQPQEGP
ncbi:hypothetical protein NM688_g5340 [Phlebia brevispora]|uniref:Uncharacterized protein n=1 Tax=Phlebia brevispora TaxID=194682 RepID=A0ACC1SWZ1_9APHY|nr:hypothetical protein NM688_g5340 [Phlebia brevispora]